LREECAIFGQIWWWYLNYLLTAIQAYLHLVIINKFINRLDPADINILKTRALQTIALMEKDHIL
jgi:hypothetical protein